MKSTDTEISSVTEQEAEYLTDEELEAYYHVDPEELAAKNKKEAKADFVSSFFFLTVSIYAFQKGLRMPVAVFTGEPGAWYAAPGAFPIFIGGVLTILSLRLCWESAKKGGMLEKGDLNKFFSLVRKPYTRRLAAAILLLVLYIFVFLGKTPFAATTFVFLLAGMLIFRRKGFAVWKLILISLAASAAITYGFGTLASIPLP